MGVIAEQRRLAVRRALKLIARRPRTQSELRSALHDEFAPDEVDHAVARLCTLGYLDDAAWAADYLARPRAQERSAALLRRELLARGISAADAGAALAGHDDQSSALRAAHRRAPALARHDPVRRDRRLRDHLHRRGFDQPVVESALRRLLDAAGG